MRSSSSCGLSGSSHRRRRKAPSIKSISGWLINARATGNTLAHGSGVQITLCDLPPVLFEKIHGAVAAYLARHAAHARAELDVLSASSGEQGVLLEHHTAVGRRINIGKPRKLTVPSVG